LQKLPEQYHLLRVDTFMQTEPEWYLEQAFNNTISYLSNRGIHTFEMTLEACAEAILAVLSRPDEWKAFQTQKRSLSGGGIE
jgi:hypothetical protein